MPPGARARRLLLVGIPAAFLLLFFVLPNALLLSASLTVDGSLPTPGTATLQTYRLVFGNAGYVAAIWRSFWLAGAVAALVCLLGYPIAFL